MHTDSPELKAASVPTLDPAPATDCSPHVGRVPVVSPQDEHAPQFWLPLCLPWSLNTGLGCAAEDLKHPWSHLGLSTVIGVEYHVVGGVLDPAARANHFPLELDPPSPTPNTWRPMPLD